MKKEEKMYKPKMVFSLFQFAFLIAFWLLAALVLFPVSFGLCQFNLTEWIMNLINI